jgi:ammonia channel protein AmtB
MYTNLNIVVPDLSEASLKKSVETSSKLAVAGSLFIFQIGFAIFEWGAVRKKNSQSAMMRTFIVICVAAITTFLFGFAIAYGDPYIMGKKYFLSTGFVGDEQSLASSYVLLVLTSSLSSNLALSSVSERGGSPSILLWIAYTVVFCTLVVPMVTAWTFGNGFLQQL